jgi:hypothetical protein
MRTEPEPNRHLPSPSFFFLQNSGRHVANIPACVMHSNQRVVNSNEALFPNYAVVGLAWRKGENNLDESAEIQKQAHRQDTGGKVSQFCDHEAWSSLGR